MGKSEPNWVTLQTADNQAFAEMTAERLRMAGIPVVLVPGDASAYMGASSPYSVNVPTSRLAEAQELLSD